MFFLRRNKPLPFISRRVLVTGAAGVMGRPICAELVRRGHWVRAMDIAGAPADSLAAEWIAADVCDAARMEAAMSNIDVVVHLAGRLEQSAFEPEMLETNIRGIYRVFESAKRHQVKRLIFASSSNTVFWHTVGRKCPVDTDASFAPLDIYSATKIFGEQLGYVYGNDGLPTISLRFGWLPPNAENHRKLDASPDYHDWYLSPGDAGPAVALSVEAPPARVGKFAVAFITSKPRGAGPFDLRPARRLLGYVPQDRYVAPR